MEKQSTSKLLRLMVAVFALFLLVITGSVLSACGGTSVAEHKHEYGSPVHEGSPTCGATGYDVYTCSVCGDKYAIVTAATGAHSFKDGHCTVCGIADGEDLAKILNEINSKVGTQTSLEGVHKHNFSTQVEVLKETCLTYGMTVMKCDACGSTSVTDFKQALGHEYNKENETGKKIHETCTTDGQVEVVCTRCGDTYWKVDEQHRAKGHSFTVRDQSHDVEANCISPRRIAYTCANEWNGQACGEIEYTTIGTELGSHKYSETSVVVEEKDGKLVEVEDEDGSADTDKTEITKEMEDLIDIGTVQKAHKCEFCGEFSTPETVAKKHNCNFTHLDNKKNLVEKVEHYQVDEQGKVMLDENGKPIVDKTEYFGDPTCDEDGMENWTCVYKNCPSLEYVAGKWEQIDDPAEDAEEGAKVWDYVPSGETDKKEKTDDGKTNEWREKLNHGYVEKLKQDGKYPYEEDIKEITEIDRDEHGDVITTHDKNQMANNTSTWLGQTCPLCGREIAFERQSDNAAAADLTKIHYLERGDYGNVVFANNSYITRAWHSWVLYDEEQKDSVVPEGGEEIKPPKEPEGYEKNKEATCTEDGWEWYWCMDDACRQEPARWVKVIIPAHGHKWKVEEETIATCTKNGTITLKCTYECEAEIEVTIKDFQKITGAEGWTWNRHTVKNDDFTGEGAPEFLEEYLKIWELELTCENDENVVPALRKANKIVFEEKTETEPTEPDTTTEPTTLTLAELLERIVPRGHQWEEAGDVDGKLCYNEDGKDYYCKCEMENCHVEGSNPGADQDKVKCTAIWHDVTMTGHLVGKDYDAKEYKTFTIYGFCGTNNHGNVANNFCHSNYTVTYCPVCYAIIKVEKAGDNFRHMPFNRETIFGHLMASAPLNRYTEEELKKDPKLDKNATFTLQEIIENPMLLAENGDNYSKFAAQWNANERKAFVEAWINIESYWMNPDGKTAAQHGILQDLWIRDGKLECWDCYGTHFEFKEIEDLAKMYKETDQIKWSLLYYVKGASGEMIQIDESNRYTFNSCEYKYYSQYKIWCEVEGKTFTWYGTIRDMTKTEWDKLGQDGQLTMDDIIDSIGKYTPVTVKNNEEFEPDGKHYLVPAYEYYNRENFKLHEDNTVTMDWVCAFCGATFELQVKYVDNTVTTTGDPAPTTSEYKENVSLVTKNEKLILLVDMLGVKFKDKTLNTRTGNNDEGVTFQSVSHPIYGKDIKNGKTNNGEGEMSYIAEGTVIIQEVVGSDGLKIGRRLTSDNGSNYFDGNSWQACPENQGSKLRVQDFADPTAKAEAGKKTLFETIWAQNYSTEGIKAEEDSDGNKRLEVANRLDNLIRAGGEIVVGSDLENLTKQEKAIGTEGYSRDYAKDEKGTEHLPLATVQQTDGKLQSVHRKANGDDCGSDCSSSACNCGEDCKQDGKCTCKSVPVLFLEGGTTLDLNGHTIYANIFIGNGDGSEQPYADDGRGHTMTEGEITVKNGTIVMSPAGNMQITGSKAHLTLDNVTVSGGAEGIFASNGATITIKNSSVIEKGFAISSNNVKQGTTPGEAGSGSSNFELENSAFVSTDATAFYMPAKGNVYAKNCEFYGYEMGAFIRGTVKDDEKAEKPTRARFVDCLFAKGDQASGYNSMSDGTGTTHFGALVLGSDLDGDPTHKDADKEGYGLIENFVLNNCTFEIIGVADQNKTPAATGGWTPATKEETDGSWVLTATSSNCTECSGTAPTNSENHVDEYGGCTHRLIVLNINGCTEIEGKGCMDGTNECNEKCKEDKYGKLTLHMDKATFDFLCEHAPKCAHKAANSEGDAATYNKATNPFLGCTFTDGAELKGKCCKLKIYVADEKGVYNEAKDFDWTGADVTTPAE